MGLSFIKDSRELEGAVLSESPLEENEGSGCLSCIVAGQEENLSPVRVVKLASSC